MFDRQSWVTTAHKVSAVQHRSTLVKVTYWRDVKHKQRRVSSARGWQSEEAEDSLPHIQFPSTLLTMRKKISHAHVFFGCLKLSACWFQPTTTWKNVISARWADCAGSLVETKLTSDRFMRQNLSSYILSDEIVAKDRNLHIPIWYFGLFDVHTD